MIDLDAAYADYLRRLQDAVDEARRATAPPCLRAYPMDPPGPGYIGTRCTRPEGHGVTHGLRIGTQLVEWH